MLRYCQIGHGLLLLVSCLFFSACDVSVEMKSRLKDLPTEKESPVGDQTQSQKDNDKHSSASDSKGDSDEDEDEDDDNSDTDDIGPRFEYVGTDLQFNSEMAEAFKERNITSLQYFGILRRRDVGWKLSDVQHTSKSIFAIYSKDAQSKLERWDWKDKSIEMHSELDLDIAAHKIIRKGNRLYIFGSKDSKAIMYQIRSHNKKGFSTEQKVELGKGRVSDVRVDGKSVWIVLPDANEVQHLDLSSKENIAAPVGVWKLERPLVSFKYKKELLVVSASNVWFGNQNEEPEVFQLYDDEPSINEHQISLVKNHIFINTGSALHSFDIRKIESGRIYFDHEESFETSAQSLSYYKDLGFVDQGSSFEILNFENVFHPYSLGSISLGDDRGSSSQIWLQKTAKDSVMIVAKDIYDGARILRLKLYKKPSAIELVAAKYYSPSIWEDAAVSAAGFEFEIPAVIPVVSGNAGNHHASIFFDKMECVYKGGSAQSHPNNNAQWSKGLFYKFESCSNGMGAGDRIQTEGAVSLRIANGDSYHSPTQVSIELKVY